MKGLVLCGGESRRMGCDKALLRYHDVPQFHFAAGQLAALCADVFVSCRPGTEPSFAPFHCIPDLAELAGHGPMTAVLSAFRFSPGPWLVVGCDYPLLVEEDLGNLLNRRRPEAVSVVYEVHGIVEPLIGLYEKPAGKLLEKWLAQENDSLRRFLENHPVVRVQPTDAGRLRSFDHPQIPL